MRHFVIGVALVLLGAVPVLAQDEPRVSLSTSVNYSVGDYGTGTDTTIVYIPFTLGVRPFDRFWLNLTVPFLYQHGQNVVITGGGVASRKGQKGKLAQPTTSSSEEGLGDVLLKASLVLVEERDFIPEITPYLKIKFPTADEDRGLGTGEFDETVFGFVEGSTAIARGQDDPVEFRVGAELKLIKALKLTGSVSRGLTDGAADWGVSMGLALRF